jgi:hypothetical protein
VQQVLTDGLPVAGKQFHRYSPFMQVSVLILPSDKTTPVPLIPVSGTGYNLDCRCYLDRLLVNGKFFSCPLAVGVNLPFF